MVAALSQGRLDFGAGSGLNDRAPAPAAGRACFDIAGQRCATTPSLPTATATHRRGHQDDAHGQGAQMEPRPARARGRTRQLLAERDRARDHRDDRRAGLDDGAIPGPATGAAATTSAPIRTRGPPSPARPAGKRATKRSPQSSSSESRPSAPLPAARRTSARSAATQAPARTPPITTQPRERAARRQPGAALAPDRTHGPGPRPSPASPASSRWDGARTRRSGPSLCPGPHAAPASAGPGSGRGGGGGGGLPRRGAAAPRP